MIRVMLPAHLRTLSGATGDVTLEVAPPVTVRVADNFIPADLVGTGIYDELATSGTAENAWTPDQLSAIEETLDILTQFVNIDLNWGGDVDSLGGDTVPNPAEVGAAGASLNRGAAVSAVPSLLPSALPVSPSLSAFSAPSAVNDAIC